MSLKICERERERERQYFKVSASATNFDERTKALVLELHSVSNYDHIVAHHLLVNKLFACFEMNVPHSSILG